MKLGDLLPESFEDRFKKEVQAWLNEVELAEVFACTHHSDDFSFTVENISVSQGKEGGATYTNVDFAVFNVEREGLDGGYVEAIYDNGKWDFKNVAVLEKSYGLDASGHSTNDYSTNPQSPSEW